MKQEEATLRTKRMMAASLKKLSCQKAFSKITVKDIITDCDVNRKTFYYHFDDIYDLLRWTLVQETVEAMKNYDLMADYEEALNFVMDYIEENICFLRSIYHSLGQNELRRFLYRDFITVIHAFVDEEEQAQGLVVSDEFKNYLCDFFAEAIAGSILVGIDHPENYNRQKVIRFILCIFYSSIPCALKSAVQLFDYD